ncbi:MAG: HEPN domain-containing protein [Eubacteriales bacterium]
MSKNNDYYKIACSDVLYVQATLHLPFYNQNAIQAQQITEKMLKSVVERVCVEPFKLLTTHNLRALYMEIHKEDSAFILNKGALSMLKDFYFDAKYPGDNYVDVDQETCDECLEIMYATIEMVNQKRIQLGLEIQEFEEKYCM